MNTKHWKLIQGFALAALLPLCAACSSEDDNLPLNEEKQPVQVSITRATMDGSGNWSWQNNDQVGLSINGTTQTLAYNNGSWTPAITGINLPATVEAWWPYRENVSVSSFTYTHNNQSTSITTPGWSHEYNPLITNGTVDQSTMELLAQSDWMTTGATTVAFSTANLTMQHRLCKVTVNIVEYSGWGSGNPAIDAVRFYTVDENEIDGIPTTFNFLEVIPLAENNQHTYTAIVSAYEYSNADYIYTSPLLRLKVNGNTDLFASYQTRLESGHAYTFNLTVKNPNATTRSASTSECELELVEVQDMNE